MAFLLTTATSAVCPALDVDPDVDVVITTIKGAMPHDWRVYTDLKDRPEWTRSDETCPKLKLYGPTMAGYRYLDASGRIITEKKFLNEAIVVWVTPKGFNSGWTRWTRFQNSFTYMPVRFPKEIGDYNGVRVYAEEGFYDPLNKVNEPSPQGTVTAVPIPVSRTWQGWQADIEQAIKALSPTR